MTRTDSRTVTDRRLVIYAVSRMGSTVEDYVAYALGELRPHAVRIVVALPAAASTVDVARFDQLADEVWVSDASTFNPEIYEAIVADRDDLQNYTEVVLTGDSWFGPVADLAPVLDRMARVPATVWAMVQKSTARLESFPDAGFAPPSLTWMWTAVRVEAVASAAWTRYWDARPHDSGKDEEAEFVSQMAGDGTVAYAFAAQDYPSASPAVFTPTTLIEDGCPFLSRELFLLYPPYLDRFAIIGREILADLADTGFPMAMVWANLAETVQPKALYAIAGMLEVLSDESVAYDVKKPFRLAVVVHVTDLAPVAEILERLTFLPSPYSLFVTTTDGKRGERLQRMLERRSDPLLESFDVRVTPANRGRDMSDFFVGCRDVLLGGGFDLVIKVHARRMRGKSDNVRRYFRRYQYENLLNSPGYVANLLSLFQKEPGLGVVFPPMMHIGYSLMGSAWGGLREPAKRVADESNITVPFDAISPLAPFGGMWIGRPEALAPLLTKKWLFRDYGKQTGRAYGDLAKVQERLISYAAGAVGYHSRTVLTRQHASISHTMLESKTDNLFSTTRGWPVEQIAIMQRAGDSGHGGIVALTRMYIRVNHPTLARFTMPIFELALRAAVVLSYVRRGVRIFASVMRGRAPEASR